MDRVVLLEKINDIFKDVFDDDTLVVTEQSSAKDIDDWDSLNNIQIVIAVEKELKVKFLASEIRGWKNIGEMCDSIMQKSTI